MKIKIITSIALACLFSQAQASELDPVVDHGIPQGLVVRISPDGKREAFKATLDHGIVENSAEATEVINKTIKEENKVQSIEPLSELDRTSSDESWHWAWNASSRVSGYYSYNYHCGYRNYSYYPSYTHYYGGYQYNYYYTPSHFGYHRGYHYDDQYGYHYGGHHGWHGPHGH